MRFNAGIAAIVVATLVIWLVTEYRQQISAERRVVSALTMLEKHYPVMEDRAKKATGLFPPGSNRQPGGCRLPTAEMARAINNRGTPGRFLSHTINDAPFSGALRPETFFKEVESFYGNRYEKMLAVAGLADQLLNEVKIGFNRQKSDPNAKVESLCHIIKLSHELCTQANEALVMLGNTDGVRNELCKTMR